MSDSGIRRLFAICAAITLLLVIYASALPVKFVPVAWGELWTRFLNTPWLTLGLDRRADWVANGLILIPFGFFYAAAWDWPSSSFGRKQLTFISFAIIHALIVCAIEAMQICFPPRTVSLNDMLAGYIGGVAGVFLWYVAGQRIVRTVRGFFEIPKGLPRFTLLAQCCAAALVVYGTMPLDVMLSPDEWSLKFQRGDLVFLPFTDWGGPKEFSKTILLNAWAFPLGVVLQLHHENRKRAIGVLSLWCIAIELASLPVFTSSTSITDVIVRIAIGTVGVLSSQVVDACLKKYDRPIIWLAAAFAMTGLAYVAFIARFESVVKDPQIVIERIEGILVAPFARAQKAPELVAAQNIAGKILLFAMLGFLLSGWRNRSGASRRATFATVAFWSIALGIIIEVTQAFLLPLVADITDIIIYTVGGCLGFLAFWLLTPERERV